MVVLLSTSATTSWFLRVSRKPAQATGAVLTKGAVVRVGTTGF